MLALWLAQVGSGADGVRRAVRAVEGVDEPHAVELHAVDVHGADVDGAPDADAVRTLPELVAWWGAGSRTVAAVLPAPGDLLGLPPAVAAAALECGECVLVETPRGAWAALPEVEEFGSVFETGYLVTWHVHALQPWTTTVLGTLGTVAEADRDLRTALLASTQALTALDVSRWRDDAAEAISRLRGDVDPQWDLPSTTDARRLRVLVLAARLRGVVEIATADDGGAVNLWQADQRSTALREIDHAARRAMAAATLAQA